MCSHSVRHVAGQAIQHESAALHVTGKALYTDDLPERRDTVHVALGLAQQANAPITRLDLSAVRAAPGVVDVVTLNDVPGKKYVGPMLDDEPVFADGVTEYVGQPLFAVAAETHDQARRAAQRAQVDYGPAHPVIDVEEGAACQMWVLPPVDLRRGDVEQTLSAGPFRHQGELYCGGQEQFYLEGQIAYAIPGEEQDMHVYCSTQHPTEMQKLVADVLQQAEHTVRIECRRMGGGFGGKESQSWPFAVVAALVARRTGRPAKLRVDRDDDFMITGKRHDFRVLYDVAYTSDGLIRAITLEHQLRCGYSADLSRAVADRQVFHTDNTYYLDTFHIRSLRVKTHTQSNTAFRGFGGPDRKSVV